MAQSGNERSSANVGRWGLVHAPALAPSRMTFLISGFMRPGPISSHVLSPSPSFKADTNRAGINFDINCFMRPGPVSSHALPPSSSFDSSHYDTRSCNPRQQLPQHIAGSPGRDAFAPVGSPTSLAMLMSAQAASFGTACPGSFPSTLPSELVNIWNTELVNIWDTARCPQSWSTSGMQTAAFGTACPGSFPSTLPSELVNIWNTGGMEHAGSAPSGRQNYNGGNGNAGGNINTPEYCPSWISSSPEVRRSSKPSSSGDKQRGGLLMQHLQAGAVEGRASSSSGAFDGSGVVEIGATSRGDRGRYPEGTGNTPEYCPSWISSPPQVRSRKPSSSGDKQRGGL
eukprot:gene22532-29655_t